MILAADARVMLSNISNLFTEDDRAFVDVDRTERLNAGRTLFGAVKLAFRPGTDGEVVWRLKKYLDRVALPRESRAPLPPEAVQVPAPTAFTQGMSQQIPTDNFKILVDAAPWKRPHIKAVSRFQGCLKTLAAPAIVPLRAEMGPPKSSIYHMPVGGLPLLLAEFGKNQTWEIFEDIWNDMMGTYNLSVTLPAFQTELLA